MATDDKKTDTEKTDTKKTDTKKTDTKKTDTKKTDTKKDDGDTGALKVTDQYLRDFAERKIKVFVDDIRSNPVFKTLYGYANKTGGGTGPGSYAALLAGNPSTLASAKELQDQFKNLCVTLDNAITGYLQTMDKAVMDLQMVQQILQNAEDEAVNAAQMMYILNDVMSTLNTKNPTTSMK